jgi:DNA ligase D-like protein (predicted 3'-phosphoesterase)
MIPAPVLLCLACCIGAESYELGPAPPAFAIRRSGRDGARPRHTEAVAELPRFVVQLHDATTLHYDLRLQSGQVLRSWAVPKGPSLDPGVRRLAVPVADHSLAAGEFEGVHDGQARGSGAVIIWDEGTAEIRRDEPAHISFALRGSKLSGGYALTRTGERRWVLVKVRDEAARPGSDIVAERPASVRSGRTWRELAGQ